MGLRARDLLTKRFALRCLLVFLFLEALSAAYVAGDSLFACDEGVQFFGTLLWGPFVALILNYNYPLAYGAITFAIAVVLTMVNRRIPPPAIACILLAVYLFGIVYGKMQPQVHCNYGLT